MKKMLLNIRAAITAPVLFFVALASLIFFGSEVIAGSQVGKLPLIDIIGFNLAALIVGFTHRAVFFPEPIKEDPRLWVPGDICRTWPAIPEPDKSDSFYPLRKAMRDFFLSIEAPAFDSVFLKGFDASTKNILCRLQKVLDDLNENAKKSPAPASVLPPPGPQPYDCDADIRQFCERLKLAIHNANGPTKFEQGLRWADSATLGALEILLAERASKRAQGLARLHAELANPSEADKQLEEIEGALKQVMGNIENPVVVGSTALGFKHTAAGREFRVGVYAELPGHSKINFGFEGGAK